MTWKELVRLVNAGAGFVEDAWPKALPGYIDAPPPEDDGWIRAKIGRITITVYGVPHEVVARLVAGKM